MARQEWDKAIETFNEVLEDLLYSTPHFPMTNLGAAYYFKQNYNLSIKYYNEALEMRPRFLHALRGLARTYIAVGNVNKAITLLEKAIDTAPKHTRTYMDLAEAYKLVGKYKKALESYRKVIDLDPESTLANQAREQANEITKGAN
jgi:tetratricopeptide (TPR) repeat protein